MIWKQGRSEGIFFEGVGGYRSQFADWRSQDCQSSFRKNNLSQTTRQIFSA